MKKKKRKIELREAFKKITVKFSRFTLNTWYFTVAFFLIVLVASVWIWWICYYAPKPSQSVMADFESKKEDFGSMKDRTEKAIDLLREKRGNYFNVPDLSFQRELFAEKAIPGEAIEPGGPIVAPEGEVAEEEKPQAGQ